MSLAQPWRDQAEMLAALRDLCVQEYYADENVVRVVFFPVRRERPSDVFEREERPLPAPPRTLEQRLFDPLGIGKDGRG